MLLYLLLPLLGLIEAYAAYFAYENAIALGPAGSAHAGRPHS